MRRIRSICAITASALTAVSVGASVAPTAGAATPQPAWKTLTPAASPPPSNSAATAFDDATGQLVLFDGVPGPTTDLTCSTALTWTWDGGSWSNHQQVDPPDERESPAMAYDAATKQVVMFGGYQPGVCKPVIRELGDTWAWNGATWSQQLPATQPDERQNACAAYDVASGQFIMFGGRSLGLTGGGAPFDDTWQWTGSDWNQLSPATTPGGGPCAMTYDPTRKVVVMLVLDMDAALASSTGIPLRTWTWNGTDWQRVADFPAAMPASMNLVFDPVTGTDVTYVGESGPCTSTCTKYDQTWAWDGSAWGKVALSDNPDAGSDSATGYDAATRQLVMVGGSHEGGPMNTSTWVYAAPGSSSVTPSRLAGANRQATAVAVSKSAFPTDGSASAVVLARADVFADALAGGPLAAAKHAPLLLTSSGSLDAVTKAEISRVLPSGGTVYLLGGTSALSDDVTSAVTALGDVPTRVAGADRFATAVAIADEIGDPTTVFEASGTNFPDALSAVPAAVVSHGAILLTNGSAQASATAIYLGAHAIARYAVGGPAEWADPTAIGVAGADRYSTSEAVALAFFPAAQGVSVASGATFPDALSAGPVAGAKNEPVLLVPASGGLPAPVSSYLATHAGAVTSVRAFGGASAVADSVLTEIANALH